MIEHFARSTAQVEFYEAKKQHPNNSLAPYEIGLKDKLTADIHRIRTAASLWKQQYIWGKFGKGSGLTIEQANDVFDASVLKLGHDTKRVVSTVVFLAKNLPRRETVPSLSTKPIKPKVA